MTSELSNDNTDFDAVQGPDAHGQAAMLLIESLIHGLIARDVMTVTDAVEIVEVATDVKREIAAEFSESPASLHKSLEMLKAISISLGHDLVT